MQRLVTDLKLYLCIVKVVQLSLFIKSGKANSRNLLISI